jgi:uncharacterized phage protein (TIGR01671 family)
MREIKFRAWDNLDKKMREVSSINWFDKLVTLDEQPNGDYLKRTWALCELMQYTGLKDKNGKEIYEGDLLSDDADGEGEWVLHRVIWDADHAGFVIEVAYDGKGNWQPIEDGIYWQPRTKKGGLMDFEVIGNIYENPELLTNN